jgi:exopolyphosphatase/guanosine-5'-triphosphate,3'-diphosphate pyrophosphatase
MTATRLGVFDLGSNSFRAMVVDGRQTAAGPSLDAIFESKMSVRLAAGLNDKRELSDSAQQRALTALGQLRSDLHSHDPVRVRAVATNTFRVATNAQQFIARAQKALGMPIEVISGEEEARLIYRGAAFAIGPRDENRLVIDIGGGSTEFIVGHDDETIDLMSLPAGSVAVTTRYFDDGSIERAKFARAVDELTAVVAPVAKRLPPIGWHRAFGTSGTFKTLIRIMRTDAERGWLDRTGLDWMVERALAAGHADRVAFRGLREDRRAILAGGLAIVTAIFECLPLSQLHYASGALREGVLLEMLEGRPQERRSRTRPLQAVDDNSGAKKRRT